MSHKQMLQLVIAVILVISFLVGCGSSAPTAVSEAPAVTSAPEQAVATPTPEPPVATSTPEPPTATPVSPTATPIPPTPTSEPPTATPTPSGPKAGHWEGKPSVSVDVTTEGDIRDFKMVTSLSGGSCTIEQQKIALEADDTFDVTIQVGKTVEAQPVSGKFDSATTLTGDFMVFHCGDILFIPAKEGNWSAEWKEP